MTNELATRWMVTFGDSSVIVPGRRMHAREAYVSAAPMLDHPPFSEVTCDDIGPGPEEQASDEPGLGPQEFIPHGSERTWAESFGAQRAEPIADGIRYYLARSTARDDERDTLAGQLEELSRERDALLEENAMLRSQAEELPTTEEKPAGGAGEVGRGGGQVKMTLEQAITEEYGDDPHLGEPHPETIDAIAGLVRSMIRVSKKRPEAYKNEPWLSISADEHVEHADHHTNDAYLETDGNRARQAALDSDDELHSSHAALRLAFYEARLKA